jgi:hypothetical protein
MLVSELLDNRRAVWTEAIEKAIKEAPEGVDPESIYSEDRNTVVDFIRYNDGSIAFHVQFYNGSFDKPIMHTPFPLRDISDVLAIVAR